MAGTNENFEQGMKKCLSTILAWNIRQYAYARSISERNSVAKLQMFEDMAAWDNANHAIQGLYLIHKMCSTAPEMFIDSTSSAFPALTVPQLQVIAHDSKFAKKIVDELINSPYGFDAKKLVSVAVSVAEDAEKTAK